MAYAKKWISLILVFVLCLSCIYSLADDVWICPECGNENTGGKFCSNCGVMNPNNASEPSASTVQNSSEYNWGMTGEEIISKMGNPVDPDSYSTEGLSSLEYKDQEILRVECPQLAMRLFDDQLISEIYDIPNDKSRRKFSLLSSRLKEKYDKPQKDNSVALQYYNLFIDDDADEDAVIEYLDKNCEYFRTWSVNDTNIFLMTGKNDGVQNTVLCFMTSDNSLYQNMIGQKGQSSEGSQDDDLDGVSGEVWVCDVCGEENTTKYCLTCGTERSYWVCACGHVYGDNDFCGDCGRKRDDMIDELNAAIAKTEEKNFSEAIEIMKTLGDFDSGSFNTDAGTHVVAKEYLAKIYYEQGEHLYAVGGDLETMIESFDKAGDYQDAKTMLMNTRIADILLKESEYAVSKSEDEGLYIKSEMECLLNSLPQENRTEEESTFYKQINDILGIHCLEMGDYDQAIESFYQAGDFPGASDQLWQSIVAKTKYLIELNEIKDAVDNYLYYTETYAIAGDSSDLVVVEPNSQGDAVKEVLALIKPLGIKAKIPADEDVYKVTVK